LLNSEPFEPRVSPLASTFEQIDPRAALSALKTIGGKEFDELEVGDQPLGPDERRGGSNNSNDNDDDKGGKK